MIILSIKARIGSFLNRIPYTLIPYVGRIYNNARRDIYRYESMTLEERKDFVFKRVFAIVKYVLDEIPFYKEYYRNQGFQLTDLKSFDDIPRIPIINKTMLLKIPVEQRSVKLFNMYLVNTGGSSGNTLSFYKTINLKVKEMAYIHYLWSKIGYRKDEIRLHFVGRGSPKNGLNYNILENSIQVDVFMPYDKILSLLADLRCDIYYLHGYPSVLYEFALYCENHRDAYRKTRLDKTLKGAFLKSEYPFPMYRKKIEEVFCISTFSHYGHTEVCGIAGELHDSHRYDVLQSYGYVSECMIDGELHLLTTTYDNYASPLIQYDTGDSASNCEFEGGLLESFEMSGGRCGDFIVDKDGNKISLTGVIFGKHHRLFNYCSQVQISQSKQGLATIYFVPKQKLPDDFVPEKYFDTTNINLQFSFKQIDKPIKTKIGKVLLKVDEGQLIND